MEILTEVGFEDCRIVERFDCYRNTSKEGVARQFGVRGANVYAQKP